MKKTFIETNEFTDCVKKYLSDDALAGLQQILQNDPDLGTAMPGCGGLRKIRLGDSTRGKGKRGGLTVIYLHVEELDQIHLITVYEKDQKDDLSADDKSSYKLLVRILKDQSRRRREA